MMRSLYSGVSGLQNHQVRMDVLGDNIANVNTTGFKKGRVQFQDLLYQMMSGAAKPNDEVGGVNPKEIGLGMSIASIDVIHTQGSLQTTGNMTDVALQGNGFFVLKKGESQMYTRAGAFSLDREGTLVNPGSGLRVQGWKAQTVNGTTILNTSGPLEDLVVPVGSKDPAKATGVVRLACNLDKRIPEIPEGAAEETTLQRTWRVEEKIFDSFGTPHILRIDFQKLNGVPNQWQATVNVDPESTVARNSLVGFNAGAQAGNTFNVEFDNTGKLLRIVDAQGQQGPAEGKILFNVGFDVPDTTPGADGQVRQNFSLDLGEAGSTVGAVTQYAERSSTKVYEQDGYTMGYLENFKIDQSGIITGVYSNGQARALGQIAIGTFTNPGGLEKIGETNFVQTNNSGLANIGPSGIAGKGKIIAGTLEMSNVDLAEQFTDMIVTQRGFQASSKTIQTSDQMLQELLGLKR